MDLAAISEIITSGGIFGLLGGAIVWLSTDRKTSKAAASSEANRREDDHKQEIRYYRVLAFSLLQVSIIALVEDENKAKAIVATLSKPADTARDT